MHYYLKAKLYSDFFSFYLMSFFHCRFPTRVQFSSVTQLCPTLCDPMDYSMPGLPVCYQLLEFTQTHVH